jgi:LemA protein
MSATDIGLLVAGIAIAMVLIWVIVTFNRFVLLRNQVHDAWAQVEVQLRRRYDLIPNLVETVQGYAAHEQTTLRAVTEARAQATTAQAVEDVAANDDTLTRTLKGMFAVAEAYPDLKADGEFLKLQEELRYTENRISYARQYYDDAVKSLNIRVSTLPSAIVASLFHVGTAQFFQLDEAGNAAIPVDL